MDPHYGRDGQVNFDPVEALIAYHAALNAHDIELVETLMAPNAIYASLALGMIEGRSAIIDALRDYFSVHPDHVAWDDSLTALGPREARAVWQLTASNSFTKEKYHRRGEETVTFDNEGTILRVDVVDFA